jgi:predicted enzyme related to lactoylglutathione lyase
MATRKAAKTKPRKVAKKKSSARRPKRAVASARKPAAPKIRHGLITHTELASADPVATRTWCERVLGWKFAPAVPTSTGPYHIWRFETGTGGGIRGSNPSEVPGSIPYCEMPDIQVAFARALTAGATVMFPPAALPGGMGWTAIVAAPGGVPIGLWAPK